MSDEYFEFDHLKQETGDGTVTVDLVADDVRFRQNPAQFLSDIRKFYKGENWRGFHDSVGARIFYDTWRDQMLHETIGRPVVQNAISSLVDRRMEIEAAWPMSDIQRLARKDQYTLWVNNLVEQIGLNSMPYLKSVGQTKFTYWVVGQIFSRCYHQGLHINYDDIHRIRTKAKELEAKGQSILLFPCHKSHIDYMSLVFAFYRLGLSLPATIAGDNLNIPVVHSFLRNVGALYIRRGKWSEDPLYSPFFQALVETLLRNGHNFQCFIEGTRSRTGKLLPPKFGILKYILETILSGAVEDAWVLPISTQYDKVVEADTYATELLGKEKKAESLRGFLESSSVLSLHLGRVDIRFGELWSLRGFIVEQLQMDPSTASFPLAPALNFTPMDRIKLLRSLGYRILADINQASAVMPSALVGTAMLTTSHRGISREELEERCFWLIQRVIEAGGQVCALPKPYKMLKVSDIAPLVDNALSVLGSDLIVCEHKTLLEPVYYPKDEFKLSYYRNQTVFLFVSESIVCLAIFTLARKQFTSHISLQQLENKVKFLSQLLQGEFVYKPEGLTTNLEQTLESLVAYGVISRQGNDHIKLEIAEIQNESKFQVFDFYCYLVWPYIDGYWSVLVSLLALPLDGMIEDRKFYRMAQTISRTLYAQGELVHSEALNQEMIKFAVSSYENQGILNRVVTESGVMVKIADKYRPTGSTTLEGPLYELSEEVALSRNKTPRYGTTNSITSRMLEVCKPMALELSKL